MQGSDRGFGKVKSFLKSSFSDCVTVGLMFSTACVLLSSTYCSRFLVGVYRHYHPWHGLSPSMSVLVCIAGPLYPRKLVVGQAEIIYILHLTTGQKKFKISSCIQWKGFLFLSFAMSIAELLAPHTGKQRRLFIIMCQAMACLGRRCCWPWVKIELLSLAVLIDSWVFMSNMEGSISSISRGFGAAATAWLISVFLSRVFVSAVLF